MTAACNLVGAVQRATSKAEQMQIEKYSCIVKTPIQVTGRVRRPVFGTDSSHIVLQRIMLCVAPHCNGVIRVTKRHITAKLACDNSSVQNELINSKSSCDEYSVHT